MRLCYLDESGYSGGNLLDPQQPFYIEGGLIVSSGSWRAVDSLLQQINQNAVQAIYPKIVAAVAVQPRVCREWANRALRRREVWGNLSVQDRNTVVTWIWAHLSANFEVHAVDLFQGGGDFLGVDVADRLAIADAMLQVAENNGLDLLYARIDKQRHYYKYKYPTPADELAFMLIAELFESYLSSRNEEGMFIGDHCGGAKRLKSDLRRYQNHGTPYYFGTAIGRIIDSVHFVVSQDSPCIQLSDLCTYLILQHVKNSGKWQALSTRAIGLVRGSKWFP